MNRIEPQEIHILWIGYSDITFLNVKYIYIYIEVVRKTITIKSWAMWNVSSQWW